MHSLSLWVATESNDPISYTNAKEQDRGKKVEPTVSITVSSSGAQG